MQVRWSPDAAEDLERIHQWLRENSPEATHRIVRAIYDGCMSLKTFPLRGRVGREPGSRELILPRLPWLVVYRVKGDFVEISRIWHGAQNRQ